MDTRKIYVVSAGFNVANWMQGIMAKSMEEADIVVFPGGADVSPHLYGEKAYSMTRSDPSLDKYEKKYYDEALAMGKKMVGICRGAQFLCAMAGGKLVQHQSNVGTEHPIYTYDGAIIQVSSDHHQAMYPWGMKQEDYQVLGWSIDESHFHLNGGGNEIVNNITPLSMEVEICFFPKIKALGIQAHPECQFPRRETDPNDRQALAWMTMLLSVFMSNHDFKEAVNAYSISDK